MADRTLLKKRGAEFLNGIAGRSFTDRRIQLRFGASDMVIASQCASGSRYADLQLFQLPIERRQPQPEAAGGLALVVGALAQHALDVQALVFAHRRGGGRHRRLRCRRGRSGRAGSHRGSGSGPSLNKTARSRALSSSRTLPARRRRSSPASSRCPRRRSAFPGSSRAWRPAPTPARECRRGDRASGGK